MIDFNYSAKSLKEILTSEHCEREREALLKRIGKICLKVLLYALIASTCIVAIYCTTYSLPAFWVFGGSCVLLAFLYFVIGPLWVAEAFYDSKKQLFVDRGASLSCVPALHPRTFYGFLGTGEVLLGNFGDQDGIVTYDFICLFYFPLFPIGCYQGHQRIRMSWREVAYVYLRQWLLYTICFSSLSVFAKSLWL